MLLSSSRQIICDILGQLTALPATTSVSGITFPLCPQWSWGVKLTATEATSGTILLAHQWFSWFVAQLLF